MSLWLKNRISLNREGIERTLVPFVSVIVFGGISMTPYILGLIPGLPKKHIMPSMWDWAFQDSMPSWVMLLNSSLAWFGTLLGFFMWFYGKEATDYTDLRAFDLTRAESWVIAIYILVFPAVTYTQDIQLLRGSGFPWVNPETMSAGFIMLATLFMFGNVSSYAMAWVPTSDSKISSFHPLRWWAWFVVLGMTIALAYMGVVFMKFAMGYEPFAWLVVVLGTGYVALIGVPHLLLGVVRHWLWS